MWHVHTMFDEENGTSEPDSWYTYNGALLSALRFAAEALTWKTLALEGSEENGYLAIHFDGAKHPTIWLTEEEESEDD